MDFSLKQSMGIIVWLIVCHLSLSALGLLLNQSSKSIENSIIKDYFLYDNTLDCVVVDRKPPTLEINSIHLNLNDPLPSKDYISNHIYAFDEVDGDINGSITINQIENIDMTKSGAYPIIVTAVNSADQKSSYIINVLVD